MLKKLLFFLFFLISATGYAKHLEFMGIPINGSITSFQNKLLAKGCSVSKENKLLPTGIRGFHGLFAGKDCDIYVWYNPRTKIVYSVRAVAYCGSTIENAQNVFNYFKNLLTKKYEDMALTSDMLEDSDNSEYEFDLIVIQPPVKEGSEILGTISVGIIDYDDYPQTYSVAITYEDLNNSSKNEQNTLDDL